jgi:hemolysin III
MPSELRIVRALRTRRALRIKPTHKPRLRGVSHEIAFYVSLASGLWLVLAAPEGASSVAMTIYALSVTTLFGVSALYHRRTWLPVPRARMRRLDHAAIFLLIAGTYTPITTLAMDGSLLVPVWTGAGFGIVKSLLWVHAPRWLNTALYVGLGWLLAFDWAGMSAGLGEPGATLLLAGGVLYSVGALIYASRRPDPAPLTFGYHEIFHLLVVFAAVCHFTAIATLVL